MHKAPQPSRNSVLIDTKGRKILYELDINARRSNSDIGRRVGLSKQVVAYRVNKMLRIGVIQKFYAVLDTSKLGFTTFKIFIRLQNIDLKTQTEIIGYLESHPKVQFLISTDGNFDLVFNVLSRNAEDLYSFMADLERAFGNFIAEKEMSIMVFSSFFSRDYLIGKRPSLAHRPIFFGSRPGDLELSVDKNDKKILSLLGIDGRMPFVEISNRTGLNAESISARMKSLERSHLIQGYLLLPSFSLLGQLSYKVVFALRNLTEDKERMFLEYSRANPNIWFHSKSLGRWDLEINLDVDDASQFRLIMMDIKSRFSGIIREYSTLQVAKVHKFNFYPFKE